MWQQRLYPSGACTSYRCSSLCSSTAMSRLRSTPRRLQGQNRAVTRRYPERAVLGDRTGSGRTLSDPGCAAQYYGGMLPMRHVHARPCGRGTASSRGSMSDRRLHSLLSPCAYACVRGCSRVGVRAVRACARRDGGACLDARFQMWRWLGSGLPESGYPDKGPRKLGDGVLIVVHSGWLAASRPPAVSGLK